MIHQAYEVDYKGLNLRVYVDGGGLDIEAIDDKALTDIATFPGGKSSELFNRIFDIGYERVGLRKAIELAGATVKG